VRTDTEKITERLRNEKNPEERQHLKNEIDQIPLSSAELEQVQQREIDRKANDIREFREKRKQ